ncbi:MAG: S9 family peptidase [Gammaproteobacteria bacterium]|nr:S9 family peptidase [Gammaproteobacteria bacterium]
MLKHLAILILPAVVLLGGCAPAEDPVAVGESEIKPPVAKIKPRELVTHGHTRIDNYYWLRDDEREDPDVLGYLDAENDYLSKVMAHTDALQENLYQELIERIKPNDESVPFRLGDYYYFTRFEEGKEHPVYSRRKGGEQGPEEILLDVNVLAEPYEFYEIGNFEISADAKIMAYAEDSVSRGQHVIKIKNLETGELYPERIENADSALAWAADNETLFYIKLQEETLIPYQVYRHKLGTDPREDELVYEEKDSAYFMWLGNTRDKNHILVYLSSTSTSEMRLLPVDNPQGEFKAFLPRESDHEYFIEPLGDVAYIRTNWNAENFRLMKTQLATSADKNTWQEVVPHRKDAFIQDFTVFDEFVVLEEMDDAVLRLRVLPLDGGEEFVIKSDEAAYAAFIDFNPNTDTTVLRYSYESMATAGSIFDYDMASGERVLRKQQFEGKDYDPQNYETRRVYATARDGTSIPISLLYRKGAKPDGTHPLYVLGYGSYGNSYEATFRSQRLSLVNRDFVFALAHIRGGQERGRQWYEGGKLFNKKNTFTDFIEATQYLVDEGWGDPNKVVGSGRSAGGLLIGAVANMAPHDLFTALVTEVPFVDVITTMLDESIPLTTFEYNEWGNPNQKDYYDYMLSYSPYDQVEAKDFPHMLVSTGLWDPAVQYWEPAKWVAKLRATKTDDNLLLMHTNMNAGHRGGSVRFERMRDRAREYAFIFDVFGVN